MHVKTLALSTRVYTSGRMANKATYGRVISARIATQKAKQLAKLAKSKSTESRTYRVSDLLRIAADEFLARHKEAA